MLVVGPRQAGKTTLIRQFISDDRPYLTLDDPATFNRAKTDPVEFIRSLNKAVIDEIQRAPELMMVIKESVDRDTRPAGSCSPVRQRYGAADGRDSLAGRIEIIRLLPLSQAEIAGSPGRMIDRLFCRGGACLAGICHLWRTPA